MTASGDRGQVVVAQVELYRDQLQALDALAADIAAGDRSRLLREVLDDWLRGRAERFVWNGPGEPGGPDFDLR